MWLIQNNLQDTPLPVLVHNVLQGFIFIRVLFLSSGCNLRDSARRMVERSGIWQRIMAVPQGSVEVIWEDRTILMEVVGE